ncbi:MAG: diguanylate cyclase [Spirochaetales bacterium]|nr:diguanylate cyclase [Spirochaetales bacterium]
MIILHINKFSPDPIFENSLKALGNITFVHLSSMEKAIKFLNSNIVCVLIVGEFLTDELGIKLIEKINNSEFFKIPIIYIVEDSSNNLLEHYSTMGIKDCLLRSDLTFTRINTIIDSLIKQKQLDVGMSSLSVAIVDDSELSLKVVHNILKDENFTSVTLFSNPVELLKNYAYYDLFFVDIVMPSISGDKLVGMIRKMSPNSIVIAMSTVDNVKTISHVLNAGADDYVVKPINKVELLARIRTNYRSFMLLKELERVASTDSLTGALNHGNIFKTVREELKKAKSNNSIISMALLDLDHFKDINDTFGHLVGDDVLVVFSQHVQRNLDNRYFFGRYGGEEFLILMPDTTLKNAFSFSDKLREDFSRLKINGISSPVTFSGGIVQWDGQEDFSTFLKRSDDLLYESKDMGRNKISF